MPSDLLTRTHRQYLRNAGISDEIIDGRQYMSISPGRDYDPASVRKDLKNEYGIWVRDARQLSGILIPLWGTGMDDAREPVSYVYRPDTPETDARGKPKKYVYPHKQPPVLDLHPATRKRRILADTDVDLWITEGAKKADALTSRGLAVIMISGVQMWRSGGDALPDWNDVYLRGRTVCICFDADASVNYNVARAMGDLGAFLASNGANVKYIVTPGDPKEKTGADDFLADGGTIEELLAAASDEPPKVRRVTANLTDTDVYPLLAEHFANRYIWVKGLGWLRWSAFQWKPCSDEHVREEAAQWVRQMWEDAMDQAKASMTAEAHDLAGKWRGYQAKTKIDNVLALAKGKLEVDVARLDANPDLLNCANGTVNLRTQTLLPHNPADYITKTTGVRYIPGAKHRDWELLWEAVPEDIRDWLLLKFGQAVTGYTSDDDIITFLYGIGANGKTALVNALRKALGDYYLVVSPKALLADVKAHSTDLADLHGARQAVLEELPERYLSVPRIKALAGGTSITARHMYQDNIAFDPTHTLFVTTNYKPKVSESDHGTWRRLALVRFPYRFVDEPDPEIPAQRQGDPGLRQRIAVDQDGQIAEAALAAVVGASGRWYEDGQILPMLPERVVKDTEEWREESDVILRFWNECLEPARDAFLLSADLYYVYENWARANGTPPMADKTLFQKLAAHEVAEANGLDGPRQVRVTAKLKVSRHADNRYDKLGDRVRGWRGVRLKDESAYGEPTR